MTGGGLENLRPDRMFNGAKLTLLAEDPKGNFPVQADSMDFEYDGDGMFPSRLVLKGSVVIDSPDGKIRADNATVILNRDAEGGASPVVKLKGHVSVDNPMGNIRSREAEIDYLSGQALFSGDVLMNSEQIRELHAKSIELNLKTNEYRILEGKATIIILDAGGALPSGEGP